MIKQEIIDYVEALTPPRSAILEEMERFAQAEQVPIMELTSMNALLMLLKLKQPAQIVEIGTAIGYSAIQMAEALPSVQITTIERDETRYKQALDYISRANLSDRITVIHGDAKEAVESVAQLNKIDVLFIDAAKGQYQSFFELYTPFLDEAGLVISDNILFRGLVAKEDVTDQPKRYQKLVEKIQRYNKWLSENQEFETRILPIGDGLACSIKKDHVSGLKEELQ